MLLTNFIDQVTFNCIKSRLEIVPPPSFSFSFSCLSFLCFILFDLTIANVFFRLSLKSQTVIYPFLRESLRMSIACDVNLR